MKLRFIGDVHGKFLEYQFLIGDCLHPSIQVGDFGVGFSDWNEPPWAEMVAGNHRFIRGNHDNPTTCKRSVQWIPDGTIENGVMFCGGGLSIDRELRTEGVDWWPEEELSITELYKVQEVYLENKPRIMVTHDCPEVAAMYMEAVSGRHKLDMPSRTRQAFQAMWEMHQPELWIFGHWHYNFDQVYKGTRFICLAELAHIDLDV